MRRNAWKRKRSLRKIRQELMCPGHAEEGEMDTDQDIVMGLEGRTALGTEKATEGLLCRMKRRRLKENGRNEMAVFVEGKWGSVVLTG